MLEELTIENIKKHEKNTQKTTQKIPIKWIDQLKPLRGNDHSMIGQLYVGDLKQIFGENIVKPPNKN